MGRNIEIKAHASDLRKQLAKAADISDSRPEVIDQKDVFFACKRGRLKLRIFDSGRGELIHYERADTTGPKESRYRIFPVEKANLLAGILRGALGEQGVVRKSRTLLRVGNTRLHFDEVEGLGSFIELEVVLNSEETKSEGRSIAQRLMQSLGIKESDLIDRAYIDLLRDEIDGSRA